LREKEENLEKERRKILHNRSIERERREIDLLNEEKKPLPCPLPKEQENRKGYLNGGTKISSSEEALGPLPFERRGMLAPERSFPSK